MILVTGHTLSYSKGLSNIEASKGGLEQACSHGQHILYKHDQDNRCATLGNTL